MKTYRVEKKRVHARLLDQELRTALGARCDGAVSGGGVVDVVIADDATTEELALAETVVAAHDPDALTDAEQAAADLRAQVLNIAQGAVGTAVNDLSTLQLKVLLGVLLWRAGALDGELKVRPLGQWAT